MIVCKACGKRFEKNFGRHVKVHYKGLGCKLLYIDEFYRDKIDILQEYTVSMLSAKKIAEKVMLLGLGLFPVQKSDVLAFLSIKGAERRNTSEAITVWSNMNGGPWNKGLTKNDHESIMAYSISRTGRNNPIYSLTEKERQERVYYWTFKSKEELKEIRKKISSTLVEGYSSGRIQHISKTDSEKFTQIVQQLSLGWRRAHEAGILHRGAYSSSYERTVATALEDLNVEFVQQRSLEGRYRYDFFLPQHSLFIEVNGDYWHCYPPLFESDYMHPHKKMTAQEIWCKDKEKYEHAISMNYSVLCVWEHELKDLERDQVKDFIHEAISNSKNRTCK